MSTPVVAQTITSSFRCWGCSPHNYISNSKDENNGLKVSDDSAASDDSSRGRVSGRRREPWNNERICTTHIAGWAAHGFVQPQPRITA